MRIPPRAVRRPTPRRPAGRPLWNPALAGSVFVPSQSFDFARVSYADCVGKLPNADFTLAVWAKLGATVSATDTVFNAIKPGFCTFYVQNRSATHIRNYMRPASYAVTADRGYQDTVKVVADNNGWALHVLSWDSAAGEGKLAMVGPGGEALYTYTMSATAAGSGPGFTASTEWVLGASSGGATPANVTIGGACWYSDIHSTVAARRVLYDAANLGAVGTPVLYHHAGDAHDSGGGVYVIPARIGSDSLTIVGGTPASQIVSDVPSKVA